MPTIFISYRRDDSIETAGRIYSWLKMRLPEGDVFLDVNAIDPGTNFRSVISDALATDVRVVLVIIGKQWLESPAENGDVRRRLDDPDDHVRSEIEVAFQHHKVVIPVLVQGAKALRGEDLPASIAILADINALAVRPEPDFDNDMRRLRDAILKMTPSVPFQPAYVYGTENAFPHVWDFIRHWLSRGGQRGRR